jgi:hypothetical protein
MIAKRCAVRCVLLLSAGLAVVATSPARAENPRIAASPKVTVVESVTGQGTRKEFTAASLREMAAKGRLREVESGPVIVYGEHSGDQGVWRFKGVRLVDLVRLATGYEESAANALYRKRKGLYLAAYASDGYDGAISWSELLFTPTGALALVAYEWTLAKAANAGARQPFVGDLVLVVPTDTFTGAREIQALKSLELRHVGDSVVK